ncbi:DMT family transporter [Rhodoferax sp. U2-2l]|uniref:DMT family transporter n=1 Tax=Rhodoferax sp. U2-2l TaxID=2884000 RepID=UPI001D0A3319|nr:DMT family transporter [Rhodoferax sp. U2-2l]MCB8746543.1 DMT family transporter [Rhodoferax sp. U2-2l]
MTVLGSSASQARSRATWLGIAAGLGAGALWGMVFVVPRMTPGLSSVDLTAGRFISFGLMAALVMVLGRRSHTWPNASQAAAALGMSLLGATGYYLLLAQSINASGSEVPTLIIGTIPIWIMLLGKPLGLKWSALLPGLVLTAAGLVLMMQASLANAETLPLAGVDFWWGVLLALGAMASWTAFALLNAAWLKRHPQVSATEWANWLGIATGVGALLLWLVAGSESDVLLAQDGKALAAVVCIATGIGSGWAGSILWNLASRRLSVSLAGQLIVSETLFGLFYAFVWDAGWPTPVQWLAAGLFTLGILASIRAHR